MKDDKYYMNLTDKDIERFNAKVDKTAGHGPDGDCWVWTAYALKTGRGRFMLNGFVENAPRVAYTIAKGPLSHNANHTCDFPQCVNPAHLWDGTQADNIRDMNGKGRAVQLTGEAHGRSKTSDAIVLDTIARYRSGGVTLQALADELGVSDVTVGDWVNGKFRSSK